MSRHEPNSLFDDPEDSERGDPERELISELREELEACRELLRDCAKWISDELACANGSSQYAKGSRLARKIETRLLPPAKGSRL